MKRTLSLLLAALTAVSLLAACGETGQSPASQDTNTPDEAAVETTAAPSAYDLLPSADYDGWEFGLLIYSDAMSPLTFFDSETLTGDIFCDAVYTRNRAVEERYNVAVRAYAHPAGTDMGPVILQNVMAGDEPYALYVPHTSQGTAAVLSDNLGWNWNRLDSVDLTADWWNRNIHEEIEIAGYLPFAVGDFDLFSVAYSTAFIFNKVMVENYHLDDPYELVLSGNWTLDTFEKYISSVSADLNGDGVFDDQDCYGFASNYSYHAGTFSTSCAFRFVEKEADGHPVIVDNLDRFTALVERLDRIYNGGNTTYQIAHDELCDIPFDENRTLLTVVWLAQLENYRECESDYGIMPFPKYDENQDRYYTLANRRGCCLVLPINAEDPERTALVTEALTILTHNDVLPVYYDSVLGTKYARDEQSVEMLDIIREGILYDFGYFYPHNSTSYAILNLIQSKSTDAVSFIEKNRAAGQAYYDEVYAYCLANAAAQ